MSDEHDRDLQDWFDRTIDAPSREPFTRSVLTQVRRRERYYRWRRYAALLAATAGFGLLLPELFALLNRIAVLPLAVIDAGSAQWPLLLLVAGGTVYGLYRQARKMDLLRDP